MENINIRRKDRKLGAIRGNRSNNKKVDVCQIVLVDEQHQLFY